MIRNTGLGGTDFSTPSDRVKPTDLNDTFDKVADIGNKGLGYLLQDVAQNIFNGAYLGFDNIMNGGRGPDYKDIEYHINDSDYFPDIDQTNSDIKNRPYIAANAQDEFIGSTIDSNIWTESTSGSGSISQSNAITLSANSTSGNANIIANQTNGIDFNQDSTIFLDTDINVSGSAANLFYIYLRDESANQVQLFSKAGGPNPFDGNIKFRLNITPGSNNVDVFQTLNGITGGSAIDITSLQDADKWHIKLESSNSSNTGTCSNKIYSVKYLSNSSVTKNLIFNTRTIGSTDMLTLIANIDESFGSVLYYTSLDNGSTYQLTTISDLERFSSSGTQFKLKIELTSTVDNVPIQYEWLVKSDIY